MSALVDLNESRTVSLLAGILAEAETNSPTCATPMISPLASWALCSGEGSTGRWQRQQEVATCHAPLLSGLPEGAGQDPRHLVGLLLPVELVQRRLDLP